MAESAYTKGRHPAVEHWDDERSIGNGIIVTLKPGLFFYDDCGVMGFDTVKDANAAVALAAKQQGAALSRALGKEG